MDAPTSPGFNLSIETRVQIAILRAKSFIVLLILLHACLSLILHAFHISPAFCSCSVIISTKSAFLTLLYLIPCRFEYAFKSGILT